MLDYYLDCEFIECAKQRRVLGVALGQPVPTIDLISLGLVADDGREFYALNRECELAYAWADEWVRKHVLLPLYNDHIGAKPQYKQVYAGIGQKFMPAFTLSTMRSLFALQGKTRSEIAFDLLRFVYPGTFEAFFDGVDRYMKGPFPGPEVRFFTHYGAHDWVVMTQLFGRLVDLPEGFPMFNYDLKALEELMKFPHELRPPEPAQAHNALADARWNRDLHRAMLRQTSQPVATPA